MNETNLALALPKSARQEPDAAFDQRFTEGVVAALLQAATAPLPAGNQPRWLDAADLQRLAPPPNAAREPVARLPCNDRFAAQLIDALSALLQLDAAGVGVLRLEFGDSGDPTLVLPYAAPPVLVRGSHQVRTPAGAIGRARCGAVSLEWPIPA